MAQIPEDTFKPEMQPAAVSHSVLIITADKVEDTEFFYPYYRFVEEGFKVDVATPDGGEFKGKNGSGLKDTKKISEVKASQYDLLYIPGGKAPERLKKEDAAINLVKQYAASGKPIAAICHGPQLLAKAGVISGRRIAAWPEVEKEVVEAGAVYVNKATVLDAQFITGRWPGDLPSLTAKTLEVLKKASASSPSANKNLAA